MQEFEESPFEGDNERMKDALRQGRARLYRQLCDDLGIPLNARNPHLNREGGELISRLGVYVNSVPKSRKQRVVEQEPQTPDKPTSDRPYDIGQVVELVLPRFPNRGYGKSGFTAEAIRERMSKLRALGYDVPKHSKLKREEIVQLWLQIRSEVYKQGVVDCPGIVSQIGVTNKNLRDFDVRDRMAAYSP